MISRRMLGALVGGAVTMLVATAQAQTATSLTPGSWSGKWVGEGQTEGVMPATMQINAIENRDGKLFAVGETWWEEYAPWKVKAGSVKFRNAAVDGNMFVIAGGNSPESFTYTLQPDGTLLGKRTHNGKPGGSIVMKKTVQ